MNYQSEGVFCAVPNPSSKRVLRTATRVAGKPGAVKRSVRPSQSAKSNHRHNDERIEERKSLTSDPQTHENGWK